MTTTNRWMRGLYSALVLFGDALGYWEFNEWRSCRVLKKSLPARHTIERLNSIGWAGSVGEEILEVPPTVEEAKQIAPEEASEVVTTIEVGPFMGEAIKGIPYGPELLPMDQVMRRILPIGNQTVELQDAVSIVLH